MLDAVYPIFDTLCETKAKSIATMVSNEQATNVMREHSYDELFTVEKDSNNNITMIKSNVLAINEIISDVAIKIQEDIDNGTGSLRDHSKKSKSGGLEQPFHIDLEKKAERKNTDNTHVLISVGKNLGIGSLCRKKGP